MDTYYILNYKAKANFIKNKEPYQAEHKLLMQQSYKSNNLVLAGGLLNPSDGGMLIFKGGSPKIAEDFAINDPYVKSGIIEEWFVRPWSIVIGA
jgi:uncharacterized protein YciI